MCLICLLLTACINTELEQTQEQEEAQIIEEELAQTKNAQKTLDFFRNYYHEECLSNRSCYRYTNVELPGIPYKNTQILDITSLDFNTNKECLLVYSRRDDNSVWYLNNSDKCILARRIIPQTKIGYFNFKKYLPTNSVIKTEEQFLQLYTLYIGIKKNKNDCKLLLNVDQVTQTEKDACETYKNQFLQDVATGQAKKCSVKYNKKYTKFVNGGYSEDRTKKMLAGIETGSREDPHIVFAADYLCVPDEINYINKSWY